MRKLATLLALTAALPAAAQLARGARAPDFTTRGALAGKEFALNLKAQLKKGPVVLYFYPMSFTPGCSAEAQAFAAATPEFRKAGATVIGMAADPIDKLKDFSTKDCASKFAVAQATPPIIAGYDVALIAAGANTGKTSRTSYVIAPDGKVLYAHSEMSPANHVKNTLAAVREWRARKR
ncbi:peroxiredoxin [Sphingomonas turrisvirgatae]|uniref:thioredoxin-dependent peroxiredoxin n=1 Tax=Sphingomonas turrisvirgatae TaxID=1888892 RepID=A0A1E3LQP4_9SPHN|nr:redoxin domain-containing protein [Sphingomonas turrisvirgatae]ODP36063.1 peroxiredoxin [Sphingomonas turrisvirgatae]